MLEESLPISSSSTGRRGGATPDVKCFTTAIDAFAGGGDVAGARGVLARMQGAGVPPNVMTYSTLLKAVARSGAPDAGARAEAVLDEMDAAADDAVVPDARCFNAAMNAFANAGDVAGARRAARPARRATRRAARRAARRAGGLGLGLGLGQQPLTPRSCEGERAWAGAEHEDGRVEGPPLGVARAEHRVLPHR